MLRAVEKKRAYQDVVQQMLNLIRKGKLKKGDQLPTERDLTETFKVSRTTVREAIRYLESMRLVESRQGNGTYVRPPAIMPVSRRCPRPFFRIGTNW